MHKEKQCIFSFGVLIFASGCERKYDCTTWTGANDIQTEKEFVWGNSFVKVNYSNWSPENPDHQKIKGMRRHVLRRTME